MRTVKRIGPMSAFKIGGVFYAFFGLLAGALFSLMSMLLPFDARQNEPPVFRVAFGGFAIVFFSNPIRSYRGNDVSPRSTLYNLVAGWVGGLEVEVSGGEADQQPVAL